MPPQPLSSVKPNASFSLTATGFDQRPDVAQGIAQCIAYWSWADTQKQRLFVVLLGANHEAAAAMYTEMRSASAKDRSLRALALSSVPKADYDLLSAVLRYGDALGRSRHKIAHWMWGLSDDLPDGMILVNPDYLVAHQAKATAIYLSGSKVNLDDLRIKPEKVFYYSASELQKDADSFAALAQLVNNVAALLSRAEGPERHQLRCMLENDDRLRIFLSRSSQEDQ